MSAEQLERAMQWSAVCGCALIVASQYLSNVPYSLYAKSEFWLDSPFLILIKLGVILVITAFAYLWTKHTVTKWSWVRQLGTTSLLVYWVHIELIYGRWFSFWHSNLDLVQCTMTAVVVIGTMVLLSWARKNPDRIRELLNSLRLEPMPDRVSAD